MNGCIPLLPGPLREVEAYWEALRPSNGIPHRSELSPAGLENALEYTFILERVAPSVTRFRMGGHKVAELLGLATERVPFTTLFASDCQIEVARAVESVFQNPSILRAELSSNRNIARPKLDAHLLLLPVRNDDGVVSRALGVLHYSGRIGRAPRQFHEVRLNATRIVLETSDYVHPIRQLEYVRESVGKSFLHKEKRPDFSGRPKLHVIDGDKA